jgi:hypothetical protein
MAQTDTQRLDAARRLADHLFPADVVANLNLDDVKAAIGSIDDGMHTIINNIPVGARTNTMLQLLILNLPEPFKSNSTAAQKALALSLWALNEAGLI